MWTMMSNIYGIDYAPLVLMILSTFEHSPSGHASAQRTFGAFIRLPLSAKGAGINSLGQSPRNMQGIHKHQRCARLPQLLNAALRAMLVFNAPLVLLFDCL